MSPADMTTQELVTALADLVSRQNELKTQEAPIRAELLRRHTETGETTLSHDGWQSSLSREPFSIAWLGRQLGYTEADLPPDCFTEKISRVPDWQRVSEWLAANDQELPTSYALKFQRTKKAA